MYRRVVFLAVVLAAAMGISWAAEEQGEGEIRLLVRGDDIGSCHAANLGIIKCYREGILRTCELMVPCPWYNEAVKMLKQNPGLDVGIHLTVTSEWDLYKWGPITQSPTLVDAKGNFHPIIRNWDDDTAMDGFWNPKTDMKEVEAELRAQIELALKDLGEQVTHLTGHMGFESVDAKVAELVDRLAKGYNLVVKIPERKRVRGMRGDDETLEQKAENFAAALEKIGPGLWSEGGHPAMNTPEMSALGHTGYYGVAEERSTEVYVFTHPKVMEVVKRRGIKLVGYGDYKVDVK